MTRQDDTGPRSSGAVSLRQIVRLEDATLVVLAGLRPLLERVEALLDDAPASETTHELRGTTLAVVAAFEEGVKLARAADVVAARAQDTRDDRQPWAGPVQRAASVPPPSAPTGDGPKPRRWLSPTQITTIVEEVAAGKASDVLGVRLRVADNVGGSVKAEGTVAALLAANPNDDELRATLVAVARDGITRLVAGAALPMLRVEVVPASPAHSDDGTGSGAATAAFLRSQRGG